MVDSEKPTTVTGHYAFVPNPCTTVPCLPGMAYAIESNGQYFFLTRDGRWLDQAPTWKGWTPSVGDVVSAMGDVGQQTDVRGDPFFTLEVRSLAPAD
ncbi:MAG: hypothetical protein ACOX8V_01295 [Thermoleophilia bacterium]|jgi:hypothetical protein